MKLQYYNSLYSRYHSTKYVAFIITLQDNDVNFANWLSWLTRPDNRPHRFNSFVDKITERDLVSLPNQMRANLSHNIVNDPVYPETCHKCGGEKHMLHTFIMFITG